MSIFLVTIMLYYPGQGVGVDPADKGDGVVLSRVDPRSLDVNFRRIWKDFVLIRVSHFLSNVQEYFRSSIQIMVIIIMLNRIKKNSQRTSMLIDSRTG